MKTVFGNKELTHAWAHQTQEHGRNSNGSLFFRDKVLFSYGEHFPLAKLYNHGWVVHNSRSYSNTTSKHRSLAYSATSHWQHMELPDVLNPESVDNIEYITRMIREAKLKVVRIRKPDNKLWAIAQLERDIEKATRFYELMFYPEANVYESQPHRDAYEELKKECSLPASWDDFKRTHEELVKQQRLDAAKLKRESIEDGMSYCLPRWREFQNCALDEGHTVTSIHHLTSLTGHTYLRMLNASEGLYCVETSKGIRILYEEARVALRMWRKGSIIGCRIGNYTITQNDPVKQVIVAGCHTVPYSELEYIESILFPKEEQAS